MFTSPLTTSIINKNNPFKYEIYNTLGSVEEFFNKFDKIQDAVGGSYPPNNIIVVDDNTRLVEIALAGWKKEDIEVSIEGTNNLLTVEGKRPESTEEVKYIHRGIGLRNFTRQWKMSNSTSVESVTFEDGLLKILVKIASPESERRLLPIS